MNSEYICCCLADCGFSEKQKQQYLKCEEDGQSDKCIRLLQIQRNSLMDSLHTIQRQVDVIDYLIEKTQKGGV